MSDVATSSAARAMRMLLVMKLRGGVRMQVRKLKRPSSWIFLIFGSVIAFGWLGSLLLTPTLTHQSPADPATAIVATEIGLAVMFALTVVASFNHRGLYLPKEEIELAFSAPLARSELVRYRMNVNLLRSSFAGLVFGAGAALRLATGWYAFLGTLVAMLTLPLVGQGAALLLGGAENRFTRIAQRLPTKIVTPILFAVLIGGVVLLFVDDGTLMPNLFDLHPGASPLQSLARTTPFRALALLTAPWARSINATSVTEFAPWFLLALAIWLALYEGVARIPVDYRELSLATSADVAKRIQRARRGGWSAAQSPASKGRLGRGAPWIFGSGPFGAIAWHKLTTISRKSSRALVVAVVVIVFLVTMGENVGGRAAHGEDEESRLLFGTLVLAGLGTIYLCGGLRFDFRSDVEIMDRIKAWPLPAWKTFLATIVPEVVIVSALILAVVLVRALVLETFHPLLLGVVAFQPLLVLTWVALDNAVFLYAPVRYGPGQEGALQHMGRSVLLVFLRCVFLVIVGACAALPGAGVWAFLVYGLHVDPTVAVVAGCAVGWCGLVAVDGALVWLGGRMLARFDVSRDKGV